MYSGVSNGEGAFQGATLDPRALSQATAGALGAPETDTSQVPSPRGLKRSRTPEPYIDLSAADGLEDDGDSKPRKRGRLGKPIGRSSGSVSEGPNLSSMPLSSQTVPPPQTPQNKTATLPNQPSSVPPTPTQTSPPKTTPKSVIKALPTVRDHTTDQLGPEGDEYIPRDYDDAGEKKVNATGHLLGNREYKCRTFFVPNRGDKLFMLATECARVLGYRDSYLLFNKNRSLFKIIATQAEKEDLILQEILPFSYRSRQIAIVTAKSMFRQFGGRVIIDGRRVRDDYWESKAKKQGFTEEDLAGEKRPGAAKARVAAAAEATANASLALGHQTDIVYSNSPGQFASQGQTQSGVHPSMMGLNGGGQLPMITLAAPDPHLRDYSNIQRPRQELSGTVYHDRTQPSPPAEILSHAQNAADYNKQINAQRKRSEEYHKAQWGRPHDPPQSRDEATQRTGGRDGLPSVQPHQSPRASQSAAHQSHQASHIAPAQSFTQPSHQQGAPAQSSMRGPPAPSLRSEQLHGRSPVLALGPASSMSSAGNPYNFPSQPQMWAPNSAQQSPQQHTFSNYTTLPPQQSPHSQQSQHQAAPQLRHPSGGSQSQMQPAMQYPGMQGLGQGYPAPGRGLYQPDSSSQQYMPPSSSGPQPGPQGWPAQQGPGPGGNWGWNQQQ